MANVLSSRAGQASPISRLIEPLDAEGEYCALPEPFAPPQKAHGLNPVVYRTSPDGSVSMGKDSISALSALIVSNSAGGWDVALPGLVEPFADRQPLPSMEAAKQMVTAAFEAYHMRAAQG